MSTASDGNKVRVHYTGTLNDNSVFDSSRGREPMELELGKGDVIPGFEAAVRGMSPGQTRTVTIPADEAYGPHVEDHVLTVDRQQLPPDLKPSIGDTLELRHPEGERFPVVVTGNDGDKLTLDANHPLAGQDLTFEIELVEIVEE